MPEPKEYLDQLQAYALGCLDKADLLALRNYIHSGNDYPWQDLGEYQNLAALLPSILNIEIPEPILKDKVARKLYRVQDEIRSKKSMEHALPAEPDVNPELPDDSPGDETHLEPLSKEYPGFMPEDDSIGQSMFEQDEPVQLYKEETEEFTSLTENPSQLNSDEVDNSGSEEFERVSSRKTSEFFHAAQENKNNSASVLLNKNIEADNFYAGNYNSADSSYPQRIIDRDRSKTEEPRRAKNNLVIYSVIVLLILSIAGGVYAFLTISSQVKIYKSEVDRLNDEIKNITSEGTEVKLLQQMLDLPDTRIISLSPSDGNGFGRIIINKYEKNGYLQVGGIPLQSYQLWLKNKNEFVSLLTFNKTQAVDYYPFELPDLSGMKEVTLIITQEPLGGSEKPGAKQYFTGAL